MRDRRPMFYLVWGLVLLLIVLHQDYWLWDNTTLVFGFLPIALFYHMGISLAAVAVWLLATWYAWPLEEDKEPVSPVGKETIRP